MLPSASRLQLAAACAASQSLPGVEESSAASDAGTERHELLAQVLTAPSGVATFVPEHLRAWLDRVREPSAWLCTPETVTELALAYDVATGKARLLGRNLGRHYPELAPTEIPGSLDYLLLEEGRVVVVDLKTGQGDVPHPSRNLQLRFAALAAARYHGVDAARAGILHAPEGREPWWNWATFDAFDLAEIAGELERVVAAVTASREDVAAGRRPRLRVGEHCEWCPARHGCPARVAMAKRLAGEPEAVVQDLKSSLTPETAALALARWQAATKALQEVGNALFAYATEKPIAVGDGRVWGPRTIEREMLDAEKAWPVLVEKYGVAVARECMTLETSKAGIDRGMHLLRESMRGAESRPQGVPPTGKVTLKSLNEDALRLLREAGCVTKKTSKIFDEHPLELPSPSP